MINDPRFKIESYKDNHWKEWHRVIYEWMLLAILWRIWEANYYISWLNDWLDSSPTWWEIDKLVMSLTLSDNWEKSARWICFWRLFEIKYDEDSEWYETYPIFISWEQVDEAWSFEEALAYCHWYAEWLNPNKPLYLTMPRW